MTDRIINKNKWLYGPGPVKRSPKGGFWSYYVIGKSPAYGFSLMATHGVILSVLVASGYKYFFFDPQIKAIEEYYRENPPK
jgi:hypothetical protein